MYILRVVIFSLDEPNLTRILTVFKENLVKYKEKRTSREYTFILFLILIILSLLAKWILDKKTPSIQTNEGDLTHKKNLKTIPPFSGLSSLPPQKILRTDASD